MSDVDPKVTIANSMEEPRLGKNDMGWFEQHTLPDQIAAAKFLSASEAGKKGGSKTKFLGTLARQFVPPGTV